ncbi:MAG TPA: siderophore-interacting protein [Ensifer sp.]|nr:siderophore-interacting protein [Ensifer sp.]
MDIQTPTSPQTPKIERVRHELKRRALTVAGIERLSPAMLRLHLTGDDLSDFTSLAPDDHIKIFIPNPDGDPFMRDYTPRRFDNEARSLIIDFAVHEAGPATLWALSAKVGDTLNIGGPRGSAIVSGEIAHWLLIGDEAALPAIGRRIEECTAGMQVTSVIAVESAADEQTFDSDASHRDIWVHRPLSAGDNPEALIAALEEIVIEAKTFVWIAAEARTAKAIRAYVTEKRGVQPGWFKASGYWQKGEVGAHISID